uniref:Uncharacterized protein n=1 Tax=Arundo donax TaxID=35708 RepID=A0A0A9FTZ9_ARUDO
MVLEEEEGNIHTVIKIEEHLLSKSRTVPKAVGRDNEELTSLL